MTNAVRNTATIRPGSRRRPRLTAKGRVCGWSLQLLQMRNPLIAKNITTPISPIVEPVRLAIGSFLPARAVALGRRLGAPREGMAGREQHERRREEPQHVEGVAAILGADGERVREGGR